MGQGDGVVACRAAITTSSHQCAPRTPARSLPRRRARRAPSSPCRLTSSVSASVRFSAAATSERTRWAGFVIEAQARHFWPRISSVRFVTRPRDPAATSLCASRCACPGGPGSRRPRPPRAARAQSKYRSVTSRPGPITTACERHAEVVGDLLGRGRPGLAGDAGDQGEPVVRREVDGSRACRVLSPTQACGRREPGTVDGS